MFYLSAFIVGFAGSFHCAGMCGPIALALAGRNQSVLTAFLRKLAYNGGRIVTYTALGLLAGIAGHSIATAGFQQALSIGSGVLILLVALGASLHTRIAVLHRPVVKFSNLLKLKFRKYFSNHSVGAQFTIGILNGFLPCGFVYLSLAAAIASGTLAGSAGYMALFGLGTLPMMLFISLTGSFLNVRYGVWIKKASAYVAILLAIMLIVRGIGITPHAGCHH